MSSQIKAKVQELFEALRDAQSFEEIDPKCHEFNEWLANLNLKNSTLGSRLSAAGLYKLFNSLPLVQGQNAEAVPKHDAEGKVTGHTLKHRATILCGLSADDWASRNKTTRVTDRLDNGSEIDPDKYLDTVTTLLQSNDTHELTAGLIAATGRRPTEILVRGKFTALEGEDYKVRFSGQLKKRGKKPSFDIPTLLPAQYVIQRHQALRRDASVKDLIASIKAEFPKDEAAQNSAVNSRRKESVNRVIREFFGGEGDENPVLPFRHGKDRDSASSLRAAYAVLATERDCQGSFGAKIKFAGEILGHIEGNSDDDRELSNIITSLGYADYFVTKPIEYRPAPTKEKQHVIRCLEDDYQYFQQVQKELGLSNQMEVMQVLLEGYRNRQTAAKELTKSQQELAKAQQEFEKEQEEMVTLTQVEELVNRKISEAIAQIQGKETLTKPEEKPSVKPEKAEKPKIVRNSGKTEDKLTAAYLAVTTYNDTVATSNDYRLAVTNQVLRALSGCNPGDVGAWIEAHKDEVISHNAKWGFENKKDPGNPVSYANKGKNPESIFPEIKKLVLPDE